MLSPFTSLTSDSTTLCTIDQARNARCFSRFCPPHPPHQGGPQVLLAPFYHQLHQPAFSWLTWPPTVTHAFVFSCRDSFNHLRTGLSPPVHASDSHIYNAAKSSFYMELSPCSLSSEVTWLVDFPISISPIPHWTAATHTCGFGSSSSSWIGNIPDLGVINTWNSPTVIESEHGTQMVWSRWQGDLRKLVRSLTEKLKLALVSGHKLKVRIGSHFAAIRQVSHGLQMTFHKVLRS